MRFFPFLAMPVHKCIASLAKVLIHPVNEIVHIYNLCPWLFQAMETATGALPAKPSVILSTHLNFTWKQCLSGKYPGDHLRLDIEKGESCHVIWNPDES